MAYNIAQQLNELRHLDVSHMTSKEFARCIAKEAAEIVKIVVTDKLVHKALPKLKHVQLPKHHEKTPEAVTPEGAKVSVADEVVANEISNLQKGVKDDGVLHSRINKRSSSEPRNANNKNSGEKKNHAQTVSNMQEFFNETEFGKLIKDKCEKVKGTNQHYRMTKKVREFGLKKGDEFYLDTLHKDHIEVFDKHDKSKTVLKLSGKEFTKKLNNAKFRTINN